MNVAILIAQLPAGQQHPMAQQNAPRPNGPPGAAGPNGVQPQPIVEPPELSHEELDAARSREISTKAVSGILLLLLKWLKVSRKHRPPSVHSCYDADTLPCRYSQVRVHDSATARLQLRAAVAEALGAPRRPAAGRQQDG